MTTAHAAKSRRRRSRWVDMLQIIAQRSEEYVKACILGLLLWGGCLTTTDAQPAAPLLVGAVRDQGGEAVANALVRAFDATGSPIASTQTSPDGTFALQTAGAATVRIECGFCVSAAFPVSSGEPLTVIVHRFTAVMRDAPSSADVAALPYAHVESVLSLAPFVVLGDSNGILPGPSVSDRGLSSGGGLVLDDGIPVYDVAANVSPFLSVPSRTAQSISLANVAHGFRYGDRADAGIAQFETQSADGSSLAGAGGEGLLQAHFAAFPVTAAGYASDNRIESRQRLDGSFADLRTESSFDATVLAERGDLIPDRTESVTSSFSALRLSFQRTRAQRTYGQLILDRGTYAANIDTNGIGAYWADIGVRAGVESTSKDPVFIETSFRRSNGEYANGSPPLLLAASLTQAQLSTGVSMHTSVSDLIAGLSVFDVAFSGGPQTLGYGVNTLGASTSLVTPSVDYRRRSGRWSFDSLAASTFRLPTFLERYGLPPVADVVSFDRNVLLQETVDYSDLRRMRASFTAYRQQTRGLDNGIVAGIGASFSWALSTHLTIRSWFLRDTDTRAASVPYIRLAPFVPATSVGSAWLTYENQDHLRADAIFRRDLIEGIGFNHIDGSLFVPVGKHAHLFVGSEVRHRARSIDLGLRFDGL